MTVATQPINQSTANPYPFNPNPLIEPTHLLAIKEVFRKSSLANTLDI